MFCPKCGSQIADSAQFCAKCGQPTGARQPAVQPGPYYNSPPRTAPAVPAGQSVENYLVWSILTTLCCCLPFGIVAIVYASQVNSKLAAGDAQGAMEASDKARTWCIVGVVAGVILGIISFILNMAGVFANSGKW